jgi:geranyl-CoA carboxylase alpha subunit
MIREAERIGFPIMIKAVAGGGGRGMRLVQDAAALPDALRSARSEAQSAFGDPTVILERAILQPRHIEIQVFGDRYGGAIHLGERDCSVQRRHQKLIEEAPSPAVSEALREQMGTVAVNAVKAIGYEGAGTLEFLLDAAGNFYFMEMNTRLQVEHPVTEAITGLDLVELQLRIAAGEPLPLRQDDVTFKGHAIEVRLCSEDADHDFMPQSGRMALWRMPGELRVEHALQSGAEIPPYYDSMIAKVIAVGASRDEARRKLIHGLDGTIAFGVTTNRGFLAACLRHKAFAAGEATTAFIAQHRDELVRSLPDDAVPAAAVAALLLYVTHRYAPPHRRGRSLAAVFPTRLKFELDGAEQACEVVRERDGSYVVSQEGQSISFVIEELSAGGIRFQAKGLGESAVFHRDGDRLFVQRLGVQNSIVDLTRAAPQSAARGGGDGKLRAALNGRVVAVLVKAGDRVEAGQPVLTLEAMKMEHVHTAPGSGIITIDVAEGEQVTAGRIVAEIEAAT